MNLSPHFSLDEFTTSQTAARLNLDNTPPAECMAALQRTALGLEAIRSLLGVPIMITSGYRSPAVNHAVGGMPGSQHMRGEAADIIAPGFGTPAEVMQAIISGSGYILWDQCILEYDRWCHISFSRTPPRRQALVIDHRGTRAWP